MSVTEKVFQVPTGLSLAALLTVPRQTFYGRGSSAPMDPSTLLLSQDVRYSPNGSHALVYQNDGNLVLYRVADRTPVWDSKTNGKGACWVGLLNGNLTVFSGSSLWQSNPSGKSVTALLVGDNGEVRLVGPGGMVWSSLANSTSWTGPTKLHQGGTLAPNSRLDPGDALLSADNIHALWYRKDGDLAIVHLGTGAILAHTGTSGAGYATFQTDGNLVVYIPENGKDKPIWSSGTYNQGATALTLDDGGVLRVMKGATALWSSGTLRSVQGAGTKFAASGAATSVNLPEMVVSYARGLAIQARVFGGTGTILELSNGVDRDLIALTVDGSALQLSWTNAAGKRAAYKAANVITPGRWCHVAAVLDTSGVRFYRDGVLMRSDAGAPTDMPTETARNRNYIGIGVSTGAKAFTGAIADVRLWNRNLSTVRLAAVTASSLLGYEPGLSGWWTLEGAAGVRDGSPFGRHGMLVGVSTPAASQFAIAPANDRRALDTTDAEVEVVSGITLDGNGFTWQAHVCPRNLDDDATLLYLNNANIVKVKVVCEKTTGSLSYYVERDGKYRSGRFENVLKAGQWTALCVRQGVDGQCGMFANGTKLFEFQGIVLPGVTYTATLAASLRGQMAEVRLWSRMLSTAEIVDTGKRRIHGWAPGLIGCWRMDEAILDDGSLVNADPGGPLARVVSWNKDAKPGPSACNNLTFGPPPQVAPPRVARTRGALKLPGATLTDAGMSLQLWLSRDADTDGTVVYLHDQAAKLSTLSLKVSTVGDLVIEGRSGLATMLRQIDGLVPARRWTQITLTADADGLFCVYRDGRLIAREEGIRLMPGAYDQLELGTAYKGVISEVRVWARSLTEAEVTDNWKRRVTKGTGLVGRWGLMGDLSGTPGPGVVVTGRPDWCEAPSLPVHDGAVPTVASVGVRSSLLGETANNPLGNAQPTEIVFIQRQTAGGPMWVPTAVPANTTLMCLDFTARDAQGAGLANTELTIVLCYPAQAPARPEEAVPKIDLYRDSTANRLTLTDSDRPSVKVTTGARGTVRIVFPARGLLMPIFLVRHAKMGEGEWSLITPDQLLHQTLATLTPNELLKGRRATATAKAGAAGLVSSGADELAGILAGMLGAAANFSFEEESTAALAFDDSGEPAPPPPPLVPIAVGPRGSTFRVAHDTPLTRRLGMPTAGLAVAAEVVDGDLVMPESFGLVSWVKSGFTVVAKFVEQAVTHPLDTAEAFGKGVMAYGEQFLESITVGVNTVINGIKVVGNWVVTKVEEMVAAVVSLAQSIGKAVGEVIDYLKELFDWGDIVDTAEHLLATLRTSITVSRTLSKDLFNLVEQKVRDLESSVLTALGGSGVVPAIGDASAAAHKHESPPEPPGLLDFLLSMLPDDLEQSIKQLLAAFDPIGEVVSGLFDRLKGLTAGLGAEFNSPALQASLDNPAKFFDSDPSDWMTLARLLVKIVVNATVMTVDIVGDLVDAMLHSFANLIDVRVYIPVLTPYVEEHVFANKQMTVGRILCLMFAIPTTVAYKAVTGKKTGPFANVPALVAPQIGALAFADGEDDDGAAWEVGTRVFGVGVTIYSGMIDGIGTVKDEFKGKPWFTAGKFILNGAKAACDAVSLYDDIKDRSTVSGWKNWSTGFNSMSWVLGLGGLGCDAVSLYYTWKGQEANKLDKASGYLGVLSGAAGLVSNILNICDTLADKSATKGQVALACTDTVGSVCDLVEGITGALPEVDDPKVKAARAAVIYWSTGASTVCQLAGLGLYWLADQNNYAVVLYANTSYGGASKGFGVGSYDYADLGDVGNDKASSIRVFDGFNATLYEHGGFTGKTLQVDTDQTDLGNFKAIVSGLKVTRK